MAFEVKIKNLGKLTGSPITVSRLTVLAGPNATGKSFFSKALYSVFNAMNANHALIYVQGLLEPINLGLRRLSGHRSDTDIHPRYKEFCSLLKKLEHICVSFREHEDKFSAIREARDELSNVTSNAITLYHEIRPSLEGLPSESQPLPLFKEDNLYTMDMGIERLGDITKQSPDDMVLQGVSWALYRSLVGNFQVSDLSELKRDIESDAWIDIEGIGKISIQDRKRPTEVNPAEVKLEGINPKGILRLQQHSGVIYLESPAHWKLRGALNAARDTTSWLRNTHDVPTYFYDLDIALGRQYSGEVAFPKLLDRLTGTDVIGGKIVIDEGRMAFVDSTQSSSRPFSLQLTATGAMNLGILALLIERQVIDEDTFLFIDEPEANLHPRWQIEMISALFELARGGVHVVIATHSSDIIERLLGLLEKYPDAKELIALNHFSAEGVKNGTQDLHEAARDIIEELTEPYSDSYLMSKGLVDE